MVDKYTCVPLQICTRFEPHAQGLLYQNRQPGRENAVVEVLDPRREELAICMRGGWLVKVNGHEGCVQFIHPFHFHITTFVFIESPRQRLK